MGCNTSKVSKTHVEIIRKRKEVKSYIKWWKGKKKEATESKQNGPESNIPLSDPINSPMSTSDDDCIVFDHRQSDGQVNNEHTRGGTNRQCHLSKNQKSVDSCDNVLMPELVGSDEEERSTGFGAPLSSSPRKSRMANDLTVEDIEDPSDLSCGLGHLTGLQKETSTPSLGSHVPLIVHSAWSDFSVRQKNTFCAPKHNFKKLRGEVEGRSLTQRRNRPMAAKGERQKPGLTEVYSAELSIPGILVPNPKRQHEESCLNSWMVRRLEDNC